ncbi:hypothetical protein WG904_08415 [Pedobacter sp. Du54]|uniref:hypothetical protein n=1 Tax=Pedobacter anseongensis TaxID=3133439 RepID=UPI0030B6E0CD
MERFCLECKTLLNGRADKKFCDDHCRSSFNHHLRADEFTFVNRVNQILKNNRRILKSHYQFTKNNVKREYLSIKGFDFNYYTCSHLAEKGKTYFFCYEYGYSVLENDELLLAKKEEK